MTSSSKWLSVLFSASLFFFHLQKHLLVDSTPLCAEYIRYSA